VAGINSQEWHWPIQLSTDACHVYHLEPGKARLLAVYDPVSKQFGTLRLKGDETAQAVVKLGPSGKVKGRVVDENGRPLGGITVHVYHRERTAEEIHNHANRARPIETSTDGTFSAETVPGVKLMLRFQRGSRRFDPLKKFDDSVAPGKTLDLGDVKIHLQDASTDE
jgi:hypothetical protein